MTDQTRRISEFLPEVIQTDVLKKFFAATGDHLFQQDKVEYLSSYIGQKPGYYDPARDQYVSEIDKNRTVYQVDPVTVSRNSENFSITHTLFYDDLINKLRFQGALVNDHNRLFEAQYYSWGLPVDVDKLINYQNYVWLSTGPLTITLLSQTDISNIQQQSQFVYTGNYRLATMSANEPPIQGTVQPLSFTSGLKLRFSQDIDVSVRDVEYIVEGVGRRITLVRDSFQSFLAWENPAEWDSNVWDSNPIQDVPNYVLIGRGSKNQNPWSYGNRWFHKDVLVTSGTSLLNINSVGAQRPILEFDSTIKLWNFATRSRGFVNLIDTVTTDINQVVGRSSFDVDGQPLDDNMTVLFTNLRQPGNPNQLDPLSNNRIYAVTNLRNANSIVLQLLPNGDDVTGAPVSGDGVWILQGSESNRDTNWYFRDNRWVKGQSRQLPDPTSANYRTVLNQAPLFELFDTDGNSLADPAVWPGSNFNGNSLVQYAVDSAAPIDPELGFAPVTENLSARNFVFDVTLVSGTWDYSESNTRKPIPGFKFWQSVAPSTQTQQYLNNWFLSNTSTRQYVVNQYVSAADQRQFDIDQMPDLVSAGPAAITVNVGTQSKVLGVDYTVSNQQVIFSQPLPADQFVQIRTWAGLENTATKGYFEIPSNLQANPNNQQISQFSIADVLDHLSSLIENQAGFSGNAKGSNNYRDTAQDQSLGTSLLQHRAPLLKLMGLNSVNQTDVFETSSSVVDPFAAIQWAQSEYLRFYNKTVNSLLSIYDGGGLTGANSAEQWLQTALARVNVGKTKQSAWANSGFDLTNGAYCSQQSQEPTWVPPSATRLGAAPAYVPTVFFDFSQPPDAETGQRPLSMRCHNGAILVLKDFANQNLGTIEQNLTSTTDPQLLTHPVAKAWLLFEQKMYASLPLQYRNAQSTPAVDCRTVFSGKYRQTSYSRDDQLRIQNPAWQKWLTFNQIDALRNTTFDITNAFTWNYSSCVDRDNKPVPGHYRGIYLYYFDTDTPHQTPWQMLGFSQKPDWWEQEYGPAPYTSGNLHMWEDLRDGKIARGPRAGVYSSWARPGLLNNIPVDSVGGLLPPFEAGIVTSLPTASEASADWKFGDRGPIENVWLTTADSDFLWAQWTYLARPAQFVEYLWDGPRQRLAFADQRYSQWISTDTGTRKSSSEYYVHRENPQDVSSLPAGDATYYGSCGIQHWISERLIYDARNVTTFFGNLIRGLESNLGHRMGGFTDGRNIRLLVDSFGLSNNDSLLLPQEDMETILLRSASTGESFYTGVIVEYRGNQGWRVIGYDSVDPAFVIVPSDERGPKNTVVVDNQRVVEYRSGLNTTKRIPYGTIMRTRQEVYDFLVSLGRAQQAQGWTFDQFDSTTGLPRNWSLSAREFLFWSQGPWASGTYIALSPLASLIKYRSSNGLIQNIGGIVNGAYSILDRNGVTINIRDVDFLRIDDEISARTLNDQGIYGLRLYTTTLEHALIFKNQTIFNDTVYDPVLNQRQSRFKIYGYRTLNWNGRLDAPGYMVTQSLSTINNVLTINNRIIPNFEKSVNDIRKIFEIDLATPYATVNDPSSEKISSISQSLGVDLSRLAKHTVGYQARPYLTDLLVDDNVAFQFYQGMIGQKGTPISVDKLLRNTNVVAPDQEFYYFEEFAFRNSIYGFQNNLNSVDLLLVGEQISSNPQLIEILGDTFGDNPRDDVITYSAGDSRILTSTTQVRPFQLRNFYGSALQDLPTAGYALLTEVTYTVVDDDALLNLYSSQIQSVIDQTIPNTVLPGNIIWQFIDQDRGWNIYRLIELQVQIASVLQNAFNSFLTTVTTDQPHQLNNGDKVIIFGVVNAGVNIDNTFVVQDVTATTFNIEISVTAAGSGGSLWLYKSIRFSSEQERNSAVIPGGWLQGNLSYVDGTSSVPSTVYSWPGRVWEVLRTENFKTDAASVGTSLLYDNASLQTMTTLTLWDPVKNRIPGILDREISFKTPYDPAKYTNDPSGLVGVNPDDAWGNDQVGLVWWNLSTTRFLDYEIGTDSYRRQFWGAIAPGTSIDIYEWVRSTVPPTSWKTLVAAGTDLSAIGSTNKPSGQVDNDQVPYVARNQINSAGQLQTVYYFWVKMTTTVPDVPGRSISTSILSAAITNPQNYSISWWAPIAATKALIGNIGLFLQGTQTVWQVNWYQTAEEATVHKEWSLVRPDDPRSSPDSFLWNKMRTSLVEFDAVGNSVPDLRLRDKDKYGLLIKPMQTMFSDTNAARKAFVDYVNQLLAASSQPPATDAARSQYRLNFFNSSEPEPSKINQKPAVNAATTTALNAYYSNGVGGVGSQLISVQTQLLVIDGIRPQVQDRVLVKNQTDATQNGIYVVVSAGSLIVNTNVAGTFDTVNGIKQIQNSAPGILQINGEDVVEGEKLLLSAQSQSDQNGLYVVIESGSVTSGYLLQQVLSQAQAQGSAKTTNWVLQRAWDSDSAQKNLDLAQTNVEFGSTQAGTVWYQSNDDVNAVGQDTLVWVRGPAPTVWDQRVENLAQLRQLDFLVNSGTKVLVAAGQETNSRWTIWQWNIEQDGSGNWTQLRVQSYVTPLYWSETDWYANSYDANTVPDLTFETLAQRNNYLDFSDGDIVKVNNTGSGLWAIYIYISGANQDWTIVGEQNGQIELNSALWDYATHGMGFDGSGFAADYEGFEYDSRQELNKIIEGLWIGAKGTGGLLKIDDQINEPNQVFFAMINQVLAGQTFVDWAFKTSFINLRGFAEELLPTPYYTTNKTNSLLEYVNETKPYHVKIRQFVDWRKANELYNSASTDFDKPPFADPVRGVRILDPQNPTDQQILSTDTAYKNWYQNYQTNPQLIRKLRTRLLFDRVGCASEWYYSPGWSASTPAVTNSVTTLVEWMDIVLNQSRNEGTVIEVKAEDWTLLIRNNNNSQGLANWNQLQYGLNYMGKIDVVIRDLDQAFALLNSVVQVGYTALIKIDNLRTPVRYYKTAQSSGNLTDWIVGAYQHWMGAVDRINQYYQPSAGMIAADDPLLISGCASKLTGLDGADFSNQDAWDKSFWDNVRGWDYSEDAFDIYDQNVSGGAPVGYWIYKGDGSRTKFGLPKASQDPNNLKVWVNGIIRRTPQDWFVANYVSQALVSNGGLGYTFNDEIQLVGGTYFPSPSRQNAQLEVLQVNGGGAIEQLSIVDAGQGFNTGDELDLSGGSPSLTATVIVNNTDSMGRILGVTVVSGGSGYTVGNTLSHTWAAGPAPALSSAARFKVTGVDFIGRITSVSVIDPGKYMMVPSSNVIPVTGGTGINATINVLWGGRMLEFFNAPSEPAVSRPNVWIVENGSTFVPAVSSILDTAFDGAQLNRPDLEGGHPEELNKLWLRSTVFYDVYTVGSAGWGNVETRAYQGDGITDQFDIGQDITSDGQVSVYVNGLLQTWGYTNDYVINYEYMRVLFVNGAPTGQVSIVSVGYGGASKSLGSWTIANPGRDYNLFDTVTLTGGLPSGTLSSVQINAVKCVDIAIVNGGENYTVGDRLLLRYGIGSQTLTITVAAVAANGTQRGIISAVTIELPGYYTNLPSTVNEWFTDGSGIGADLTPSWGAANLFVINRGLYYQEPISLTQQFVTPIGALPATGNGLVVGFGQGHIREQIRFEGNGQTDGVKLLGGIIENQILVTWNGAIFTNWGLDSVDASILIFNQIPQPDDIVYITVYNSQLYSLNRTQSFVIALPNLTYTLQNPPGSLPAATKNVLVYKNGAKMKSPWFWQGTGNGSTTQFNIGIVPTSSSDVTVWVNTTVLDSFLYVVNSPAGTVTFANAPTQGSQIIVQVADTTTQNFDYLVIDNEITISSWAVAGGETISVTTFAEDSQTSIRKDQFAGTSAAIYSLSAVPAVYGSVQVFLNGLIMEQNWDYQIVKMGNIVSVEFGSAFSHVPSDLIEVVYSTRLPAKPNVAYRMFRNIYDDTNWLRLSDTMSTRTNAAVLWNSETILIADGTKVPDASDASPGVIWIGAERIEYREKITQATTVYPNQVRLGRLSRGTLGTPGGINSRFICDNYSGDGQADYFPCSLSNPYVFVNNTLQILGVDYTLQTNPESLAPGIYVKFSADSIPPLGSQNVQLVQAVSTIKTSNVSHPSNSLVRDASANQQIPAGIRWPAGNQGIQYSAEPQTPFLLAEPGSRLE